VLLHGHPAVDIYNGIKLAAGGELGVGVGEEEWGSGERAVLEDLTSHTDGLVDLMVCRFGEAPARVQQDEEHTTTKSKTTSNIQLAQQPWMGVGDIPRPADGVVFSGMGAFSRNSIRSVTSWVESIYTYGEHAYGVKDIPGSNRRKRRKRNPRPDLTSQQSGSPETVEAIPPLQGARKAPGMAASNRVASKESKPTATPPQQQGIPPPIVSAAEHSLDEATALADEDTLTDGTDGAKASANESNVWMDVLTLGYTRWGPSIRRAEAQQPQPQQSSKPDPKDEVEEEDDDDGPALKSVAPDPEGRRLEDTITAHIYQENNGHFAVGLKGSLENDEPTDDETACEEANGRDATEGSRIMIRTLYIETVQRPSTRDNAKGPIPSDNDSDNDNYESQSDSPNKPQRLRVLLYIRRPFIYTLLFRPQTDALSIPAFYRTLHKHLAPLHKPLCLSTSPARVAARIASSNTPYTTTAAVTAGHNDGNNATPIYDLVYDPKSLTIRTSIPLIPDPGTPAAEGLNIGIAGSITSSLPSHHETSVAEPAWTRMEALNVYGAILATVTGTRERGGEREIERTGKTGRGWWVVWVRVAASDDHDGDNDGGDDVPGAGELGQSGHADGARPESDVREWRKSPRAKVTPPSRIQADEDAILDSDHEEQSTRHSDSLAGSARDSEASGEDAETRRIRHRVRGLREAILVRRSRDAGPSSARLVSSGGGGAGGAGRVGSGLWNTVGFGMGMGGAAAGGGSGGDVGGAGAAAAGYGPARLAEGIGVDARRYVEGLLSLNR